MRHAPEVGGVIGERTREAYGLAAPTYDAEPNSVLFLEDEAVLGHLDLRRGERLLDAACGTGKYLAAAARAGVRGDGLDFSPEMLRLAKGKCPESRFKLHDLEDLPLPFPRASFDAIIFAHGIRHVGDIKGLFLDFARLLRPGGRLVVSVTHPDAPFRFFKYRAKDLGDYEEPDLSGEKFSHNSSDMAAAGRAAGLRFMAWEIVKADRRLGKVLTEASLRRVMGKPLIGVFKFDKPRARRGSRKTR